MHRHRFLKEAEVIRMPQPPAPEIPPHAFVLIPAVWFTGMTWQQWWWQQQLYRYAFEQAQAVVRPSLPERDLLAVWN
jgi:hypothetical protein